MQTYVMEPLTEEEEGDSVEKRLSLLSSCHEPNHTNATSKQYPSGEENNEERKRWSEAIDEWASVEERPIHFTDSAYQSLPLNTCSRIIAFEEALAYFQEQDLSLYAKEIQTSKKRSAVKRLLKWIFGPPRLKSDLQADRNLIFTLAKYPFQNNNEVHLQALQTIYRKLTSATFDCPRFGNHWEEIGFQGTDPSTDLRGGGTLALIQLLFFCMSAEHAPLVNSIYKLSRHPVHNFPFSVMSINVTKIALEILREDLLNRECNLTEDVWSTFNRFYAAIFLELYDKWKEQGATIRNSGFIIQSVTKTAKKEVEPLLQRLTNFQEQPSHQEDETPFDQFTDICLYSE